MKPLKIIKWAIALLILGFLINYLIKNINQVDWSLVSFNYLYLIIAIIIIIISYLFQSILWWLILRKKGLKYSKAHKIYFSSLVGRYVPGKALLVITRILRCKKQGIKKSTSFTSIILDLALYSLSAILLFIITLPNSIPKELTLPLIIIGILLLPLIHPKILKFGINLGLKILKKPKIRFRMKFHNSLGLLLLHIIRWFLLGIGTFFLLISFIQVPISLIYILPGILALSIVLGMLMILSPGGLGIREGLLVLLLTPYMPVELAILFSLISRILLTLIEAGLALYFEIKPQ
jgi:glycosyltransferase 2 family protein